MLAIAATVSKNYNKYSLNRKQFEDKLMMKYVAMLTIENTTAKNL